MTVFSRACAVADLAEDQPRRFVVGGVPVAVVRTEGEVFAIHDVCSHANVALSEGEVDDQTIECWLHGSRFDSGHRCAHRPAGDQARSRISREDRRR